jgi:ketopantoate reductase
MREDIIRAPHRDRHDSRRGRGARQHKIAAPTIDTMVAMVKGLQAQYLGN